MASSITSSSTRSSASSKISVRVYQTSKSPQIKRPRPLPKSLPMQPSRSSKTLRVRRHRTSASTRRPIMPRGRAARRMMSLYSSPWRDASRSPPPIRSEVFDLLRQIHNSLHQHSVYRDNYRLSFD